MVQEELVVDVKNGVETAGLAATRRFVELQEQLLAYYGVNAVSRFVELAKPRMKAHVLEAGEGEPIVVFHGGDGEAVNWAPLMGKLQDHAKIFAVDRPGFGLSDAFDYRTVDLRTHAVDFVVSLLDALGLESATLMGGSMGGFFVLVAALARPDRVRKIVLEGFAAGVTKSAGKEMDTLCGTPGMPEAFMKGRDNMAAQKSQYSDMFHVDLDSVPDLYFETRIAGLRLPSEQGTWATLLPRLATLAGTRPEIYIGDELVNIKVPALVVWGENDLVPAELGRAIASRIPEGQFEYIPGIGHFPFLEAPEQCTRVITEFIGAAPAKA